MTVFLPWNAAGWRYTLTDPGAGWQQPDFDDSGWGIGPAGFGDNGNAAIVAAGVGTTWSDVDDIWLRRPVALAGPVNVFARIDDTVAVWVDGTSLGSFDLFGLGTVNSTPTSRPFEAGRVGWAVGRIGVTSGGGAAVVAAHARNTLAGTPRFVDLRIESA